MWSYSVFREIQNHQVVTVRTNNSSSQGVGKLSGLINVAVGYWQSPE